MRLAVTALAAAATMMVGVSTAEAQRARSTNTGMNWDTGRFGDEAYPQARSSRGTRGSRAARSARGGEALASLTGGFNAGPRPRRWCGWWMRTQLGGGPEFNLAWNWRKYGSPASPQVGAVVVWRHHVGMIVGEASNGKWLVRSGNWGGRVATAPRSVRGAVIRM